MSYRAGAVLVYLFTLAIVLQAAVSWKQHKAIIQLELQLNQQRVWSVPLTVSDCPAPEIGVIDPPEPVQL